MYQVLGVTSFVGHRVDTYFYPCYPLTQLPAPLTPHLPGVEGEGEGGVGVGDELEVLGVHPQHQLARVLAWEQGAPPPSQSAPGKR